MLADCPKGSSSRLVRELDLNPQWKAHRLYIPKHCGITEGKRLHLTYQFVMIRQATVKEARVHDIMLSCCPMRAMRTPSSTPDPPTDAQSGYDHDRSAFHHLTRYMSIQILALLEYHSAFERHLPCHRGDALLSAHSWDLLLSR